jgi:ABC-2 type transport system ATP-binding protein
MRQRAPEIAEWADLTGFIDVPLRSYSSGMLARLAFSIATDIEPDVLVVDEVLSVGDAAFQIRSKDRMENLIERGASVIIVSHQMGTVAELADRAMWIDHGENMMLGHPLEVIDAYEQTVDGGQQ